MDDPKNRRYEIPVNYFSVHVKILRFFGLWSYDSNGFSELIYTVYQTAFLFAFGYLFTVLEIIQLYYSWDNFDDFINNLCYAIVHVMACSKISLILIRAREIKKVTESFEAGIFRIIPGNRTEDEERLVSECVFRTRRLLKIYFIIGTSVVMNGLLCPLYVSSDFGKSSKTHENSNVTDNFHRASGQRRTLPYMSYFPFDIDRTPSHEIAYAYQGISMMTLSPVIVTTDVLYGSILLHIATQLRVLRSTLISMKKIAHDKLSKKNDRRHRSSSFKIRAAPEEQNLADEMYAILKRCVLHHHAIMRLVDEMERIFSMLVLLQFLCNLVIMCFPLFQITSVPVVSFPFFSMVSLMTAMMYQLFIFCNCGDEVTQESLLLANSAYFCDWYGSYSSIEMHRAILLVIVRSQRPLRLTVAKFATLSRATYLRVVQGSASYFMFLRRIRDEQ
ncbi:odorant receptor 4-like isoform X1 [Athalia rosae]|uniref:odorant receptor 4-like isoform X1 n=2 Tax=Athalia rosae TaxID=37344 RepID=UPI002033B6C4|nr:odorant receptor 4-like isoform X1 [Athalia rosae]